MLRDAPKVVSLHHHHLSAPTRNGKGLHFCTIGKIGTTQWRKLVCRLQRKPSNGGRNVCIPDTPISYEAPKAIFLRDPLERFLSAFIDKCLHKRIERHCEPVAVFLDDASLVDGLDQSKKLLFEAYVNAMPLRWNMHYFPQRYERHV